MLPKIDEQGVATIDLARFGLDGDPEEYRVKVWGPFEAATQIEAFVEDFGADFLQMLFELGFGEGPLDAIAAILSVLRDAKNKLKLEERLKSYLRPCMRMPLKAHPLYGDTNGGLLFASKDAGGFDNYYRGRFYHLLKLAVACFYTCGGDFFGSLETEVGRLIEQAKKQAAQTAIAESGVSSAG